MFDPQFWSYGDKELGDRPINGFQFQLTDMVHFLTLLSLLAGFYSASTGLGYDEVVASSSKNGL